MSWRLKSHRMFSRVSDSGMCILCRGWIPAKPVHARPSINQSMINQRSSSLDLLFSRLLTDRVLEWLHSVVYVSCFSFLFFIPRFVSRKDPIVFLHFVPEDWWTHEHPPARSTPASYLQEQTCWNKMKVQRLRASCARPYMHTYISHMCSDVNATAALLMRAAHRSSRTRENTQFHILNQPAYSCFTYFGAKHRREIPGPFQVRLRHPPLTEHDTMLWIMTPHKEGQNTWQIV